MNSRENWYKTFFNGLALEMWDNALPQAYTESEIRFIKAAANLPAGAEVLDVPCGSGRHSIALARDGFRVTGIDIADGNIKKLNEAKGVLPIETLCADVLEKPIEGKFDAAVCLGNSFSYFPYDKMVEFAGNVQRALKPGAKFIINSGAIAESIIPNLKDKTWILVGDILFLMDNQYETENSVLKTTMQFIKNGMTETRSSWHFVFTLAQIKRMLTTAGFTSFQVYSGLEKEEYKLGSHQAYVVAGF